MTNGARSASTCVTTFASRHVPRSRSSQIPTATAIPISGCGLDRKSTRLNSSHLVISYAVFCLKKKKTRMNYSHLVISYAVFGLKKKTESRIDAAWLLSPVLRRVCGTCGSVRSLHSDDDIASL